MNFIYFPACSVGPMLDSFEKEATFRFYQKDNTVTPLHHKYLLISAGHKYKDSDYANKIGFNMKQGILFGDSGGFQIATQKIKYSPEIRHQIFEWLENNSNIAANLDIPPFISSQKRSAESTSYFDWCLEQSYENFKYFYEHQTGKTKYLNVLQGRLEPQWDVWAGKMKQFDFDGWCFGGLAVSNSLILQGLFYMLKNGEMDKPKNKFFHILGVSRNDSLTYLMYFAHLLKKKRGIKAYITCDSSTPFRTAAFGTYMMSHNFMNFHNLLLSNKYKLEEINGKGALPCNCPVCVNYKLEDIYNWNTKTYTIMGMHNFWKMLDFVGFIERLLDIDNEDLLHSFFPAKIQRNLRLISKCFDSTNPVAMMQAHNGYFEELIVEGDTLEGLF